MSSGENKPKTEESKGLTVAEETAASSEADVVEEMIQELPPNQKEIVRQLMIMQRSTSVGPMQKAIIPPEKIEKEHIDKILEIAAKTEERKYNDKQSSKKYVLSFVLIGAAIFVFLTIFLAKDNSDIYMDLLKVTFGFLGGLGLGKFMNK